MCDWSGVSWVRALIGALIEPGPFNSILELERVLRSRYGFGKPTLLIALNALLDTRELEFQAEPAIEKAIHAYRQSNADFADCLHVALCSDAGRPPLLTFDAKAVRLMGG